MNIKNIIHLYCNPFNPVQVQLQDKVKTNYYLLDISACPLSGGYSVNYTLAKSVSVMKDDWMVFNDDETCRRIKLFLRPLSSITREEKEYLDKILSGLSMNNWADVRKMEALTTAYLLSKHFDLFNLLESKNAILETVIK